MVTDLHLDFVKTNKQMYVFPDVEESEDTTKIRKVFFDDLANDVRYFNANSPVKEVGACIFSKDESIQGVVRKPLHIRIKHRLRHIFTSKKYKGKTVIQWIGHTCFSILLAAMGITMGYVTFLYLLFLSLAAFW